MRSLDALVRSVRSTAAGALILGSAMLTGCAIEQIPSQRVDALIRRYTGIDAPLFAPTAVLASRPEKGFVLRNAEFMPGWQSRVAGMSSQGSTVDQLGRLVLTTSDSTLISTAMSDVRHLFPEAPQEACAMRPDGSVDRALIWRVGSRGGVVIRTPAPTSGRRPTWLGRVILVRHAIRHADIGRRVTHSPCNGIAADGALGES